MSGVEFLKSFGSTARDILPVTIFLLVFQLVILRSPIENVKSLAIGIVLSVVGLYLFQLGIKYGLQPLGASVGLALPTLKYQTWIVIFGFFLGFMATVAEPALKVLALQVEENTQGAMPNLVIVYTVGLGVGLGMGLGVFKILNNIPLVYLLLPLLVLTGILALVAPARIVGVAFDTAGVTTGPVTVPLNMAMAIGLSTMVSGNDPLVDGFGVIALASEGPIITVLLLGILYRF